jgi:hypothetical protein
MNTCRFLSVVVLLGTFFLFRKVQGGVPAPPNYFDDQLVDHVASSHRHGHERWSQRFYLSHEYFKGPGSPIFVIMGGEGAIEPSTGFMYPFILQLAQTFGAMVLQPEHRFYGQSQPVSPAEIERARDDGKPDPRLKLLTVEQALHDAVRLIHFVRDRVRCSRDRFSPRYCPVITVGGSYPGFLSAMARLRFPGVVDIAYAASAPMKFYAQQVDQYAYYNHIGTVAEQAFTGCSQDVRRALDDFRTVYELGQSKINETAIGICSGTVPAYIKDPATFVQEVLMMVGYTFANHNMAFYPPSNQTHLGRACQTFASPSLSTLDQLKTFLVASLAPRSTENQPDEETCFDMRKQLPSGRNATISAGDWSGVGTGASGESWDFQTCTSLVESIGFAGGDGNQDAYGISMFPRRDWNISWLASHCQQRFGDAVTPMPNTLVNAWNFDDLVAAGATRIVFTNGALDGWSVSGISHDLSDTLLALTFPNGAHHSDLAGHFPSVETDTVDIVEGQAKVQTILATWLAGLPSARTDHNSPAANISTKLQ